METFEQARDLFLEGLHYFQQQQYSVAETKFKASLTLLPDRVSTLNNLSATLIKLEKFNDAKPLCLNAIALDQRSQEAWLNLGLICKAQDENVQAIAHFDQALDINPSYAEAWSNKAAMLYKEHRMKEALVCSEKALHVNPELSDALINRGNALQGLGCYQEALACFDKTLAIRANFIDGWYNRALVLIAMTQYDDALEACTKVISLDSNFAGGWYSKGLILSHLKQFDQAIYCYNKAQELNPDFDYLTGVNLYAKMGISDWQSFDEETKKLAEGLQLDAKVSPPFPTLALLSSADMQRKAAEIWTQDQHPIPEQVFVFPRKKRDKIRIAYCSADFRNHAVSALTAELFELHDRNRFEVIALSFGIDQNDDMRARLLKAFDRFIDLGNRSENEIVQLARNLDIDIAIDLGGHTQDARTAVFAQRIAPIQVNYLGYPGTMGAPFIDYIIGDNVLIPPEFTRHYSENVVRMPHCFQVNDSQRTISNIPMSRKALGLPEHGFVFCCFNNNYKITPHVFDRWANILKQTDESVLWLLESNPLVVTNLRAEAAKRGIAANRLIFGGHLPRDEYLARYRYADLFLDTSPFNAGTTASDALWAGLPMITMGGEAFASRMAASLLHAIGLPELVTDTPGAYETLAIELANNPVRMKDIKQRLTANRLTKPLFDTPLFTRHIEAAYIEMHTRHLQGLSPDHITVAP